MGRLYDLKQSADRKNRNVVTNSSQYFSVLNKFVRNWDQSILDKYFRADLELYTRQFFMPLIKADEAPKAFGAAGEIKPIYWAAHYQGEVVAPFSGTIRFAGQGDNILVVRFDNKVVLDASLGVPLEACRDVQRDPIGRTADPYRRPMVAGEWFTVRAGDSYPMEVLLGEYGGLFSCYLLVEVKDQSYKKQSDGINPRLPVWQSGPVDVPKYKERVNSPEIEKEPLTFGNF